MVVSLKKRNKLSSIGGVGGGGVGAVGDGITDLHPVEEYDEEEYEDSTQPDEESSADDVPVIGQTESRLVYGSKILMLFILALATAGSAVGTYRFSLLADHRVFESHVSKIIGFFVSMTVWGIQHLCIV